MPTGINIGNYGENLLLDFILTSNTITRPSSWYISIYSDPVGLIADQPSQEISGNGYSRQSVSFSSALNGKSSNTNAITFQSTNDWAPVNYIGIMDASTGGNLLFWGQFENTITLLSGDQIQFAINTIEISLD